MILNDVTRLWLTAYLKACAPILMAVGVLAIWSACSGWRKL